jgi:hypothetical protein
LDESRIINIAGVAAGDDDFAEKHEAADSGEIASLAWEVLKLRAQRDMQVVAITQGAAIEALQARAMRAITTSISGSLENYLQAVKQSDELRARLAADPAAELGGVFDLVIRRALALVASAEKQTDGPETVMGDSVCTCVERRPIGYSTHDEGCPVGKVGQS